MIKNEEKDISGLEAGLGYCFNNLCLLEEALSHPSLKQHDPLVKNYEKLEILGDSLLGFIITDSIFKRSGNFNEGDIAKIKSYLVSREILVKVAQKLNLVEYLIMTEGEEKSGGRTNLSNLENTMEAIIAAIYLDSDIEQIRMVINNLWSPYIDNVDVADVDPKSTLQEISHKLIKKSPEYQLIAKQGEAHSPTFEVEVSVGDYSATAFEGSIKAAEKKAAKILIQRLKGKKYSE